MKRKFEYNPLQYPDVIPQEVKSMLIEKFDIDECNIFPDADWVNDLGCDSLDVVEIIMEFESMYGIAIPDEEAKKCFTVGQAMKLINKLRNSRMPIGRIAY